MWPRLRRLSARIGAEYGTPVRLPRVRTGTGQDWIYHVCTLGRTIGVVRCNNPFAVPRGLPLYPHTHALLPAERIIREWQVYSLLGPLGLTPRPLWRCDDALMCSFTEWPRLSEVLRSNVAIWRADTLTELLKTVFIAVQRMHAQGVVHLDLSPKNVLVNTEPPDCRIIDFEYAPSDAQPLEVHQAYDFLRLTSRLIELSRNLHQEALLQRLLIELQSQLNIEFPIDWECDRSRAA